MQDTLITVVIPCYNSEQTLRKCVGSVLEQTYGNLQIIAINDGSSDNTLEVMKMLSENDERIRFISQGNRGVSFTRNRGIDEAKGEYIAFIDADDYIEKDYIEKLLKTIKCNDAELSICQYSTENMNENHVKLNNKLDSKNKIIQEMLLPELNIAAFVWNRLYSTAVLKKNAIRFNESIYACEDTLFNYQYMKNISRFAVCGEHLYHYVINRNSAMFGEGFNSKKLTANNAFEIMLAECSEDEREAIEVAAMWFNLIVKRQIFKNKVIICEAELERIDKMLRLNPRAFMNSNVGAKYKIAYPFWKSR